MGFMPITGWSNSDPFSLYCRYVTVFPKSFIIFNAFLSIILIAIVTLLNSIILLEVLRNLRNIKASTASRNHGNIETKQKPKLRIHRGTSRKPLSKPLNQQSGSKIKRSASFHFCDSQIVSPQEKIVKLRSKSVDDPKATLNGFEVYVDKLHTQGKSELASNSSIWTVESISGKAERNAEKKICKMNGPKKWRAVTVVLLTSGSFIVTWTPFYVVLLLSIFSEDKHRKAYLASLLNGPIGIFAFVNSLLNPLIYAWWHKGFKTSIKIYFRQYIQRHILSNSIRARARDR
ncbi:unnamed protein product [Diatraea saccharalis]|uniref:G-protein coupled receptors family 1 profile domain-containing protein n=1 Tax=Diatraea saccharalis TaxID=40085 RepID=A0A9N9R4S0_9NEOP|nr:unnamed protein product [Diatraea saccharalis]